jgi:hypothetical protein
LAVPRVLAKAGALFRGAAAAAESWELWGRLEVSWLQVWSGDVGAGVGRRRLLGPGKMHQPGWRSSGGPVITPGCLEL